MKLVITALALTLALLASPASAGDIAYVENNDGGKMMLTSVKGVCKDKSYIVYSVAKGGQVIFGCWWANASRTYVAVEWDDGDFRMYDLKLFTLVEKDGVGA